ncbi:Techylectin-5A [Araneus ventricosus]|uniref:Techylectin-5A n=2 Tax=Araneus ventricosus TaxID=182803 RepID=A0A4Y2LQW9_ARAVE|nr:Techylectin-5A [Araneus ventricosus]
MTRTTPELAPPSPNFRATPTGGRLATTYDLACNRPHTRRIFSGIGFRTCDPPVPRFWLYISSFVIALVVLQTTGNESPKCNQSDKSLSYLDAASDLIIKAKSFYPVCPVESVNRTSSPMDCAEVLRNGYNESGVYTIWPKSRVTNDKSIDVFCDMDTDGGGWTVLQRRGNFRRPNDYFFQDWASYKTGFGDIEKDFWIGNDNIFALTNQRLYSIRFDMKAVDGEKRHALYDTFWIDDENNKYTLHIKDYSGDAEKQHSCINSTISSCLQHGRYYIGNQKIWITPPVLSIREHWMTAAAIASSTEAKILVANHLATARHLPNEDVLSLDDVCNAPGKQFPAFLSGSNSSFYSRCPPGIKIHWQVGSSINDKPLEYLE